MFWASALLSHIYKKHGIDAVEDAEREAHSLEARAVFKPPEKGYPFPRRASGQRFARTSATNNLKGRR
jgi:hypothetical protein